MKSILKTLVLAVASAAALATAGAAHATPDVRDAQFVVYHDYPITS